MNSFGRSVKKVFEGAAKAFQTFPASILCAFAFMAVTMVRIQLDWPKQEPYNFLFNCLHWSLAFGAVFSLTAITAAQSRSGGKKAFITANILGLLAAVGAFLLLYFFGAAETETQSRYAFVSALASARISVAIMVSLLAFIVLAAYPKERSDFARSFFMTHKAFFIALIYGSVITGGLCGVAGAVEALLYKGMSEKVYMYIAALAGFLSFTIFTGYFPDFRKGEEDEHREIAQKQPRFIEILLGFILIPIMIALTAVLLLWSGRTIFSGFWPVFEMLAGIATAYTFVGLWLHIMVTEHESGLAKFYRRYYPFAALVILAFEAAALFTHLGESGMKATEYCFSLTWILAVAASVLLILRKVKAHQPIVILTCVLAVVAILPVVGYYSLPVTSQINRLEKLLVAEGILENGQLKPLSTEPDAKVRESITDAVYYVANAEEKKLPAWFDKDLNNSETFKKKLGFEPAWGTPDYGNGMGGSISTSLYLKADAIDISGYQWSVLTQDEYWKESEPIKINGKTGIYNIYWWVDSSDGMPTLKVVQNDNVALEKKMNDYIDRITEKYPPGKQQLPVGASMEDMSFEVQNDQIAVRLVFSNVDINVDPQQDRINYWINLKAMYIKEIR